MGLKDPFQFRPAAVVVSAEGLVAVVRKSDDVAAAVAADVAAAGPRPAAG